MVALRLLQPLYLLALLGIVAVTMLALRFPPEQSLIRRRISLGLRSLVILLLTFSLAGLSVSERIPRVNTLFLLDVSDSLDELTRSTSVERIQRALKKMGENDTAGLIVFGRQPSVEISPTRGLQTITLESDVDGSATNIAAALTTALAAMPDEGEKRILLLSDGNENQGRALDAARLARSTGVKIYTLSLEPALSVGDNLRGEVYVKDILAPEIVRAGGVHEFTVVLHSLYSAAARLAIFKDGIYAGEEELVLNPGENSFRYAASFESQGLHRYHALISSDLDTIPQNNSLERFVQVQGQPAVLLVASKGEESRSFLNALRLQGLNVMLGGVMDIPDTMSGLLQYDAVIFDNVPAFDLSLAKMQLIEEYIRYAGGGLLMLGGDRSFGVGGYYKTPIERALPVDVDVASSVNIPSVTVVAVVDKSGSMGSSLTSGETKLDLVKEAVLASVDVLNPFYKIGLLAFDADTEWTIPIIEAGERKTIMQSLYGLDSGGGTNLYQAMEEAHRKLREVSSAIKHMIVLSDGLTDQGDFERLAHQAVDDRITITTVAVGSDADRTLMADIALWGGGRSYYTDHFAHVPRIFTAETTIVSRGLVVEETFFPIVSSGSEILRGIDAHELPPLNGFVLTYLKSGASQILAAQNNSPLLAATRYGLGRTAAFTSDLKGRWGAEWLRWDAFPQFAAQLIRWLERSRPAETLQVRLSETDGTGRIVVDALDEKSRYVNFLDLAATVVYPDRSVLEIRLEQKAPGEYTGSFPAARAGEYFVSVYGGSDEVAPAPLTHGLILPYSREYVDLYPNQPLLERLAEITGGRALNKEQEPGEILFGQGEEGVQSYRRLWFPLTLAALLLFVLDIAVRLVRIPEGIRQKIVGWAHVSMARLKTGVLSRSKTEMTYEELNRIIDRKRQEEKAAIHSEGLMYWMRKNRPEAKSEDRDRSCPGFFSQIRRERAKRMPGED